MTKIIRNVKLDTFSTGTVTCDALVYRKVTLDRMDVTGPRGGQRLLWRASSQRDNKDAPWWRSRAEAAYKK